jgi:superfamily II DNA/RNA helicase
MCRKYMALLSTSWASHTIRARQVANQIALQMAVTKHEVSKIITFHRSIASAASFTGPGSEGIHNHLSGFETFHVNGTISTSERESIMDEFRTAPKAVVSNARCLTEGVDLPAVDMVAFFMPKRSHVDIVQAIGRAMRKAPDKTTGYIFLPLLVEQMKDETLEAALKRNKHDEVWDVLQALQEQDEVLADIGFDDTRFREKVEFLVAQVLLQTLRDSITTRCVDVLRAVWDYRFGQLKAYKKQNGHCNVPSAKTALGIWVANQRAGYNSGKLFEERIQRLNGIGFEWELKDAAWESKFAELEAYKKQHDHCNSPVNGTVFGYWISNQRSLYKTGKLKRRRIVLLNKIGFQWKDVINTGRFLPR